MRNSGPISRNPNRRGLIIDEMYFFFLNDENLCVCAYVVYQGKETPAKKQDILWTSAYPNRPFRVVREGRMCVAGPFFEKNSFEYCLIAIFFVFLWAGGSRCEGRRTKPSFPFWGNKRGRGSSLELVVDGDQHGKIPIAEGKRGREIPFVLTFVAPNCVPAENTSNNVVSWSRAQTKLLRQFVASFNRSKGIFPKRFKTLF